MASYGDRPGLAARQELVRRGWHIDSQVQKDDKSEAKFHLARKGDDTLLAVTGTASLADIKSDLNLHSVAYGGMAGKTAKKTASAASMPALTTIRRPFWQRPMAARP